jgi:hypothetical protein
VMWDKEAVNVTADQALSKVVKQRDGAIKLLEELLAQGPVEVKKIDEHAKAHGLTMKQMHRAKEKLGNVEVGKKGLKGGWFWSLVL